MTWLAPQTNATALAAELGCPLEESASRNRAAYSCYSLLTAAFFRRAPFGSFSGQLTM
jgi:hypothetical protein